jgi:hypothetical protein
MVQDQQAHKTLKETTLTMREYAGSAASEQAIALLDALYACYCMDLVDVTPERLVSIQSAIKQVRYLRNVFANDGQDVPKI